jgi:hypothetical protein
MRIVLIVNNHTSSADLPQCLGYGLWHGGQIKRYLTLFVVYEIIVS